MTTRTPNIDLISASQACELQNNSINGQETASQATAESILSYINTQIKTNANINKDYCDIKWSSIKSDQSTHIIFTWINLTPENTEEEHYTGIQTKIDGKYINQWVASVGNALVTTNAGYRWCFLYRRDYEQPWGMRICWRPADYYPTPAEGEQPTDPIALARIEYQYIILPKIKLALPPADEVEVVHVEQQEYSEIQTSLEQLFSSINRTIQHRAAQGFNYALIPWSTLGDPQDMQSLFFEHTEDYLTVLEENKDVSGADLTSLYTYGNFTDGYYSTTEATFKTFSTAEYDIGIFDDNTFTNNDYYTPRAEQNFTLYDLISNNTYLSYGLSFYAGIDSNANPYCDGICIVWGMEQSLAQEAAKTQATTNYNRLYDEYEVAHKPTYTTLNAPTFAAFEQSHRRNNSAYLQALVTAITTKMKTAFTKNERAVYVLWKDISSNLPDYIYHCWTDPSLLYDGIFPAMHENGAPLSNNTHSLSEAFNIISNGHHHSFNATTNDSYRWEYCWYNKDGTETFTYNTTSGVQTFVLADRAPAGIVVALYGQMADGSNRTAEQQTAAAIRTVQAEVFSIVDPANKS